MSYLLLLPHSGAAASSSPPQRQGRWEAGGVAGGAGGRQGSRAGELLLPLGGGADGRRQEWRDVTEPPRIVPYYCLSLSAWPLRNNKELFCSFHRVKPGKSHTTGSLIYAKTTRRRDQSTTLQYIKVHKLNIITNQVFRT
jgi:hypothetical protein